MRHLRSAYVVEKAGPEPWCRRARRFMMRATARFPTEGATGVTETSRQRDTICPSWCELPPAHIAGSGAAGETTHRRVVREICLGRIEAIRDVADSPVRVEVEAYSDPEGREHTPTVRLTLSGASCPDDPDADDLTPAEARGLAEALLEAARLAES
jgi:Domain of unknown function (DUF6907)